MSRPLRVIVFGLLAVLRLAGETVDLSWPTRHGAPPPALSPAQAEWLPAFRASLEVLPESAIVALALGQPRMLGLPPEDAAALAPLVASRYEAIAADPEFATARGHLAYCFSVTRPTEGLARLTIPAGATPSSPVLLFIHGAGGDFLWYHHWLKSAFPNHIILSPAYGINPSAIPSAYLEECMRAAEARLGHTLDRPILVGLSAGGFGSLRAYATTPSRYRRAVILGAYPPSDLFGIKGRGLSVRLLAGASEYFVADGTWTHSLGALARTGADVKADTLPAANHFFLLTQPVETKAWLADALRREPTPAR